MCSDRVFLLYSAIDASATSNDVATWEFAKLNIEQKVENITQKWTVVKKTDMSQTKNNVPSERKFIAF